MKWQRNISLTLCLVLFGLSLQSQSFRRLMSRANQNYEIHNYNLAVEGYLKALEKRQDDVEALSKLANSYRMLNMLQEAAPYFNSAVRDRNVDTQFILAFAHTLRGLGRYDEARQWYQVYANEVNSFIGNHYVQSCDFAKSQLANGGNYEVSNELINTPFSDFAPTFAGQQQIVFSSARTDLSGGSFDGRARNQLFVSNLTPENNLGVPYLLRNGYQADNNLGVAPVAYSPDGTTVAFTRNNFINGRRQIPEAGMELRLFTAQVNPSGQWVDIRSFTPSNSGHNTGYASFSPDGQALYFASDQEDGFGGFDIYVSYRVGNGWSTPENLGAIVNSPGNEITPFFDGRDLYFASDWHHGLGGFDNFRAEQGDDQRWSQIFHMGSLVNSQNDDYGYVYDNNRNIGYLVSNRQSSSGNEDIYRVRKAANNIVLKIRNASDGSPVPNAIVDFSNCGEGAYPADVSGNYSFQAMQGLVCDLIISRDGYYSVTLPLNAAGINEQNEFIINLNKVSEAYAGKIVDYVQRTPIPNVTVRATNRTTGSMVESLTDINGDYYVSLSPYTTYDMVISAPGYQDYQFALPVADGRNPDVLGVITMLPSNTPGGGYPGGSPNPGTPTLPNEGTPSGYAVQVAAIGTPAVDRFSNINDLGQVYSVQDGNRHKIRLGVFSSRAEADQALSTVKRRGYQGAFIVREEGSGTSTPTTNPSTNPPATTPSADGRYRIQLAAYRNPQYFDESRVSNLGTIQSIKKGDLTVMLIGGINTIDEARRARQQARSAGFPGAFILVNDRGNWNKID